MMIDVTAPADEAAARPARTAVLPGLLAGALAVATLVVLVLGEWAPDRLDEAALAGAAVAWAVGAALLGRRRPAEPTAVAVGLVALLGAVALAPGESGATSRRRPRPPGGRPVPPRRRLAHGPVGAAAGVHGRGVLPGVRRGRCRRQRPGRAPGGAVRAHRRRAGGDRRGHRGEHLPAGDRPRPGAAAVGRVGARCSR